MLISPVGLLILTRFLDLIFVMSLLFFHETIIAIIDTGSDKTVATLAIVVKISTVSHLFLKLYYSSIQISFSSDEQLRWT